MYNYLLINMIESLEKYYNELKDDLQLDQMNISAKSLMIPGIKHKWVKRLIDAKIELKHQESLMELTIKDLSEQKSNESPINLSPMSIRKSVENSDIYKKLNEKVDEQKILIEYFEKIERVVNSLTYDIKNIIEIIKSETI